MFKLHTINNDIEVSSWDNPSGNPRAIVHILHGMGEHKLRYDNFAQFLNTQQISVYAHDHKGHGKHIQNGAVPGHYGDNTGFKNVLEDVHLCQLFIRAQHSQTPIFLLGHSMGSFIAQSYLSQYDYDLKGVILSGSAYTPPALIHALKWLARFEAMRLGKNAYSKIIDVLSFSSYNNTFKPSRTQFDWLSRDEQQVDRYIEDELCGFICSAYSWHELAKALIDISKETTLAKINPELACLIISGSKDPVGAHGKYVKALYKHWVDSGHYNTQLELIENARHEVLNESDRELTYNILLNWMNENLT